MKQKWMTRLLGGLIVGVGIVAGIAFATVTGTYTPSRVSTDGNATAYSFSFAVPAQGDLVVELVNTTDLSVTNQTLTTNYTVTLSKSTPGGHIDFVTAPPVGQYVQLYRDIDVTQPTDIPAGGLFREVQIENALDRSVLLLQQQQEQIDRAIKVPLLSNDTTDYATIIANAADAASDGAELALTYANLSLSYVANASSYANLSLSYVANASSYANASSGYANDSSGYANASSGYANDSSGYATNSSNSAVLASQYADDAYNYSLGNITVANATEAQGATDDVRYMTPAKVKIEVEYPGAVSIPADNINIGTNTTGVLPLDHGGTNATNATDARTNLGISGSGTLLPSGAIFYMITGNCPTGTTDVSATYSNKFVRVNSTTNTTGGSDTYNLTIAEANLPSHFHGAGTLKSDPHSHGIVVGAGSTGANTKVGSAKDGGYASSGTDTSNAGGGGSITGSTGAIGSGTAKSIDTVPSYVTCKMCQVD